MLFAAGRCVAVGSLCGCMAAAAFAQGIYSCTDARGRRITADRPIVECIDREQNELTPGGLVRRKIGPSLTAEERAAEEARAAKLADERNRQLEEKKRERALITRFPDRVTHDKERTQALATIDDIIATAHKHSQELAAQRAKLDVELEFYRNDPARVPAKLKRQVEENAQQAEGQRRFIANQEAEKQRLNARYDEELVRLKVLWAQLAAPATASAASTPAPKR